MKRSSALGNKTLIAKILVASAILLLLFCYCYAQFSPDGSLIMIHGYDCVAYQTENKAAKGYSSLNFKWKGSVWYFHNSKNRDLFATDPEKFIPAYMGYCSYYASKGYKKMAEPELWTIIDGRLYLFSNKYKKEKWEEDIEENIKRGDENWHRMH